MGLCYGGMDSRRVRLCFVGMDSRRVRLCFVGGVLQGLRLCFVGRVLWGLRLCFVGCHGCRIIREGGGVHGLDSHKRAIHIAVRY